jgi:microcystin-dependent protein
MAGIKFYDRVKETSTTTGTGTLTLSGAVTGFRAFSTLGDGNSCYYTVEHSNGSEWEVGIGTYTSSGTTLSRTTILASSNSNNAVSFSSGTKYVWLNFSAMSATTAALLPIAANSTATLDRTHSFVTCNNSGACTLTLPAASVPFVLHIKKTSSDPTLLVTIQRAGSDTIDGQTSIALSTQFDSVKLVADGSSTWHIAEWYISSATTQPSGTVESFAGSTVPAGWIECDGSAVSRTTYADLFSILSTTWGSGDGSTTFNIPDLRGRTIIGVGTGTGLTARTLGGTGGAETHMLATSEMPAHNHSVLSSAGGYYVYNGAATGTHNWGISGGGNNFSSIQGFTDSRGGDGSHNNMQPWAALKYIIKAYSISGTGTYATLSLPTGHIFGLALSNNVSDATNDIDIATGKCRSSDDTADIVLSSAITKRLDAAWAVGTNQGGLDTGSIANVWYAVWLIKRTDTGVVDVLFSTSNTSPTMPTNYTKKRRIGWILRTGGSIKPFYQYEDEFKWVSVVVDVNALNPGTSAVLRTMTVPYFTEWFGSISFTANTPASDNPAGINVQDPVEADYAPSAGTATIICYLNVNNFAVPFRCRTNAFSQLRTRCQLSGAATSLYMFTNGWIDTRGRLS